MSSDRVRQRLADILDNIARIESHVGAMSSAAFKADAKTVDAVERCLQRITEAVIKIGPERMAELVPGAAGARGPCDGQSAAPRI